MSAVSDLLANPGLTQAQIKGTPASIKSETFVDPLKQNVATPLSAFLSSQVNAGIPKYTAPVAADFSGQQEENISKFLAQDANTVFDQNIMNPTLANFKNVGLQDVREGYAGALSSSGRTSGEANATAALYADLAGKKAQFGLDMNKAQTEAAVALQNAKTMPLQANYKTWLDSQVQGNAQLKQALDFLANTTSTGTTIATALDPGQAGLYGEIFGAKLASAAQQDTISDAVKTSRRVIGTQNIGMGEVLNNVTDSTGASYWVDSKGDRVNAPRAY